MNKKYFDMVVIVPLEEELQQLMRVFSPLEDFSTATQFRHTVDGGNSELSTLVVQQEQMGKSSASRAAGSVLNEFDAGLVVCLGIAGGVSADLKLGDVCYSGNIIDVYDNTKTIDAQEGAIDIQFSPTHYTTNREVTAALNFIRTLPTLRPKYEHWQELQGQNARRLQAHPVIGRGGKEEIIYRPSSRNGTIVCGAVSKSTVYNNKLIALDRKILAIETESGGIFEDVGARRVPAVTIRGISDYANDDKKKLEEDTKGVIRDIAASNAASFLKAQHENSSFVRFLQTRKAEHQSSTTSVAVSAFRQVEDDLPTTVIAIGKLIDSKLRELSPEYRLQPKGYRLPVPRIRQANRPSPVGEKIEIPFEDIRDVLSEKSSIILTVPRTYPDHSLPWVFADDLITADFSGLQALPIVVDGDLIRPPKFGIALASHCEGIEQKILLPHVQPIFIVENVPVSSKTKLNFLVDEAKKYPSAKFIFVTRGDLNLIKESEFSSKAAADVYSISEISFLEIAHFIQKNFEMSGQESEVIALRLRNTFNKFQLSAHPTYFAGIPRETLSALLQANRRAELIQLAVDGFLTFLVAEDRADVSLSRTTRSRFLRMLAIELRVEKKNLSQADLINFAREFSDEYDFDIDPIEFIQSFFEKGILHLDGEYVRFSLSFIESYLLARELLDREDLASKYFQMDDPDFDLSTFDLYTELGASNSLVDSIVKHLNKSIDELKSVKSNEHILLTDSIKPAFFGREDRLKAFKDQLGRAVEDVQSSDGDKKRKQRILDIADKVRESAAEKSEQATQASEHEKGGEFDKLGLAVNCWAVGTVLLGAGAEHLNAATKQQIASQLIELATLVIDQWTRAHAQVSFDEIKKDLTSDEALVNFPSRDGKNETKQEKIEIIEGLVDVLEYSFLSEPFRRIIHHLCEQARHRVLAPSVQKAKVEGEMERIIHAAWLTDIDSKRGSGNLKKSIKGLPVSRFFRMTLATHFLRRVYWSHWNKEDRLTLLDAAVDAMKPVQLTINKPQLKRMIENDKPDSSNK